MHAASLSFLRHFRGTVLAVKGTLRRPSVTPLTAADVPARRLG